MSAVPANHSATSAESLQALLDLLFPDLPLVDILTLNDFTYRYPFTRLGPGAVAALERAQRATRATGDYEQMGLSEFYGGLIYLHEGQYLGAAQYFGEARRFWEFAGQATAVCLTHFAQGVARQGAYHYERALNHYGKAEKCLGHFPVDDLTSDHGAFWRAFRGQLAAARRDLTQRMWAVDEPDSAAPGWVAVPREAAAPATAVAEPTPERPSRETAVPRPIFRLQDPPLPPPTGAATEPETAVYFFTPLPGHAKQSADLIWLKVDPISWADIQAWLPNLPINAYVLVDMNLDGYLLSPNDLVIVNDAQATGTIPVRPETPQEVWPAPDHSYVGAVEKPPPNLARRQMPAAANPKDPGSIKLSPDTESPLFVEDILGIVIGVWNGLKAKEATRQP